MILLTVLFAALIGVLAGGIVNILADDLPLRRSPRLPRFVPDEKKSAIHKFYETEEDLAQAERFIQSDDEPRPLPAWLGLSAFALGKRTSSDGTVTLNWRYPLTELLTVILMVLTILTVGNEPDVSALQLVFWLAFMAIFALITVIDIEHKLILFVVIIPSCALAILDAVLTPTNHGPHLRDALIGGALGFGVFVTMYLGGFLFTFVIGMMRGEKITEVAFGYGDVMMATLSGLILGWQALIFAMFITVFLGAFGAFIYLISRSISGGKYSAFTALPYGPYIVAGTIILMLFGEEVGKILGAS